MSGAVPLSEQQQLAQAFAGMQLPQFVFNGFAHNHSASEITSIVSFGPRPVLTLIMPPVVAKSFALSLLETVERYEAATGTVVETIGELNQRMSAYTAAHES